MKLSINKKGIIAGIACSSVIGAGAIIGARSIHADGAEPLVSSAPSHSTAALVANSNPAGVLVRPADERLVAPKGQGAQPRAFARPMSQSDIPAHVVPELEAAAVRRVAMRRLPDGSTANLYISRTPRGMTCLVYFQRTGASGGGCNTTEAPFAASGSVFWTSVFSGGPEVADMTSYIITGVVTDRVDRVEITDTAETVHAVDVSPDRGFIHEQPADALGTGARPQVLRTFDRGGHVLDTVPLFGPNG